MARMGAAGDFGDAPAAGGAGVAQAEEQLAASARRPLGALCSLARAPADELRALAMEA